MLKLLFGLAVIVGMAGAIALVPIRGRTVLDRWESAGDARDFVERGIEETKVAMGLAQEKPRPARSHAARPARPPARQARPAAPREEHSAKDRAALDRIIAEHAQR